jgi:type II secretory pathway component PulF
MNWRDVHARLSFGIAQRVKFYHLLGAFVRDDVPLYEAVKDIDAHYKASGSPRSRVTARILADARGARGNVLRMSQSMAWCISPAERLALDAGEQSGAIAEGLASARENAAKSSAVIKAIVGRLALALVLLVAVIGLLVFVRLKAIPVFTEMLPRARWPVVPATLGHLTDFLPLGLPLVLAAIAGYLVVFGMLAGRWRPDPLRTVADRWVFPYTVYAQMQLAAALAGIAALVGSRVSIGSAIERMRDIAPAWLRSHLDAVLLQLRTGAKEGDALASLFTGEPAFLISAYGKRTNFAEALKDLSAEINEQLLQRVAIQFSVIAFLLLAFGAVVMVLIVLSFGQMGTAVSPYR